MEKLLENNAIKFTLMVSVLLYLSIFFVDKSLPIAYLLFFCYLSYCNFRSLYGQIFNTDESRK